MHTERGLDRLITFADAVVAIAITLLVLPLVDVLNGARHRDLAGVLTGSAAEFGAFALSFVVIARLWWAHHRLVEKVGSYDGAFVLVTLAWLLTVVLLPFASQVAAGYSGRLSVAVYIGTITTSSLCLTAVSVLVWRRPSLRREGVDRAQIPLATTVITSALFLVALVVGVALPRVNYYALLLLFLADPLERLVRRLSKAGANGDGPPSPGGRRAAADGRIRRR